MHSSNNIEEFYTQATQLLGVPTLSQLFGGEKILDATIAKDMEGAQGWDDWAHAMSVLRWTTNYMVLRNFEQEDLSADGDIDLLCNDHQALCSALAVR